MMKKEKREGPGKVSGEKQLFTLIELLIVITIIAMTLHSKSGFFMANYGKGAF